MGTAKSMKHNNLQKTRKAEDDEFLGSPPPTDTNLVSVSLWPQRLPPPGTASDIFNGPSRSPWTAQTASWLG